VKRFHLMIADLWRKCNGNLTRLSDKEWEAFKAAMDEHVDFVNRTREIDEAVKTWFKEAKK